MICYIDTSLLIKRYLPEVGSTELEARLLAEQPELLVSELALVELISTLRRKQRERLLSAALVQTIKAKVLEDIHGMVIRTLPLNSHCLQHAIDLLQELKSPLVMLDAIHLATALHAKAQLFMTADTQLSRAACEAGLEVWP